MLDEELAVDRVANVPLKRADGFPLRLALGNLPLEVRPTLRVDLVDLADGHHVDGMVSWRLPRRLRRWTIRPPEESSNSGFAGQRSCHISVGSRR